MRIKKLNSVLILSLIIIAGCTYAPDKKEVSNDKAVKLVYDHAKAWETGDYELLVSILHEDVIFAYPGRRLDKKETIEDLIAFSSSFMDTNIYINRIIVDGDDLAVEWQFASTSIETGNRTAVSDAIIGKIKDGKIILWKEYLDGRVSRMQASGELPLEEGQEPFPWPRKLKT